jgi:hypothetical protein
MGNISLSLAPISRVDSIGLRPGKFTRSASGLIRLRNFPSLSELEKLLSH